MRSAGRWPAKCGWSCGNPARAPKDSCQTGQPETLRERDERLPRLGVVRAGADDERRRAGVRDQRRELGDGVRVDGRRRAPPAAAAASSRVSSAAAAQSSIGTITIAGPRPVTASWQARATAPGTSCGAHRLVDPDRVVACEALQPAREERLEREMAAVLLPDEHDERRTVHARGRERADGVSEPGGRVQDRERRLVAPDRPAGRHADDGALVQREHEAQVVGQVGEQLDLGRARDSRTARSARARGRRRTSRRGRCGRPRRHPTANDLTFASRRTDDGGVKVTIAGGAGGVGASTAFNLVLMRGGHEIVLVDVRPEMITSHVMDLEQTVELSPGCTVRGGDGARRPRRRHPRAHLGDTAHGRNLPSRLPDEERLDRRRGHERLLRRSGPVS